MRADTERRPASRTTQGVWRSSNTITVTINYYCYDHPVVTIIIISSSSMIITIIATILQYAQDSLRGSSKRDEQSAIRRARAS